MSEEIVKGCNCNDEFRTEPCPVHYQEKIDKFNKEVVTVSDSVMVPEEVRQWAGFAFICPRCGEAAILDIMKYCGNCGVGVVIKSAKLTAFIKKLEERVK
jgi:ribosomal protein L37E